ncbi:MAG: hypothetical protein ACRD2W_05670 [Acidimicrobiales bacterium]
MAIGLGIAAAAVAAVILVVLSGGDGDGNGALPPTTSTAVTAQPSTTASPQAVAEAVILDAYRKSWNAFIAVASDASAGGNDPRLTQNTAGNSLLARQASVARLRSENRAYRGEIELHPRVVELSAITARVEDCNIDRTSVVDARTGQVVVPPSTQGAAVNATLRLEGGVWKQVEFTDERRTCVPAAS